MHRRVCVPGATLLAMIVCALPCWSAGPLQESHESESRSGDPKVFAVGEFKGWISRPQSAHSGLDLDGVGGAAWAPQGRRRGAGWEDRRWGHSRMASQPESYMILKGGGLHVTEDPTTTGGYVGVEMGGSMEDVLQIGFSLDYFHHSDNEVVLLEETESNGLPVRAEQTLSESVAHLVPVGLTLRVRMPLPASRITPFLSGTVSYEMLFLENRGQMPASDPVLSQLEDKETFTGLGWQAAAGIDVSLSQTFGLIGELGWHRSAPHQEIQLQGQTVDLKVDLDGPFLRGGLRFFL